MRNINEEDFINVCNSSLSMSEASAKLNMRFGTFKRYALKLNCYKPNQCGKGLHKTSTTGYKLEDILSGKHPGYQSFKLKNKLIESGLKQNVCECCGISEWHGKPLNMELHHKDGNTNNNNLDNLELLCPNCHSQTDNFRSKNKKDKT